MKISLEELSKAHENNFKDFLFYDIEVFAEDAIVVFKDINGSTVAIFHNDFRGLDEVIEGKVLVGYNNYYYDDYILSAMLGKKSPEEIKYYNDCLIKERYKPPIALDPTLFTLDAFQQINVAKSSLKKIEANIGLSIDETEVDFDKKGGLCIDEFRKTLDYCKQDVSATIYIFKLRWFSYFVPKLMIVNMLPEEMQKQALRWNTTTITANLLTGNKNAMKSTDWELGKTEKESLEMLSVVPMEVREIWDVDLSTFAKKTNAHYKLHTMDCVFDFSHGGLHGVSDSEKKRFENVKLLDVTSLYPNILIKLNALGDATQKYKEIVNKRIEVKHTDQVLSNALKLIINGTYGLMKNEYSKLYNPMSALSVCIYGQIVLFDLCRMLYDAGYTLVNVNTDGVAFVDNPALESDYSRDGWDKVQKQWEDKYGFELELSEFQTWIQKDVNNYVAVDTDGNIKVKGAEVNHYYDPVDYVSDPLHTKAGVNWTGNNTKSIIHHCIVNKLVYNKDFVDTIVENLDYPILFQYVLQCGRTYVGTVDENGKLYQKVNRVFAAKDGVTLKKKKIIQNKDKEVESLQYFPNAPMNMYVFNGDLRDFDNFKDIVDVDFYLNLANEKYEKLWL